MLQAEEKERNDQLQRQREVQGDAHGSIWGKSSGFFVFEVCVCFFFNFYFKNKINKESKRAHLKGWIS